MAKIKAIKSMITGEEGESQKPEATGGTSSTPAGQQEGAVLALASEQPAGRSKKWPRKEQTGPRLADKDSTDRVSIELGDQTEQPQTGKSKGPATPPAAQKNYLAHDRMIKVRQSFRDAIAKNKVQKVEIEKLKAAQDVVAAEGDELRLKVDRAEADKQRAMKSNKARYLAELRKLRDAHKEEKDKAVDDVEDRGYAQGEKTYERQVQATKDIFFQCGWKAAVEKATQNRLIAEARKEAEEEAAAAQQTEQTSPAVSQDADDEEVIDREVVTVEGADNEAEENLPERNVEEAEQTVQVAEQTAELELD
ncbi:uncharacterized protein LOC114257583 [Camellia sinensis]|uniref:uncharacterized protein LOC114257583 n=1 Tax=Camellia sinensis TaxID=4442 RepID=UPI001036EE88|nr:uncharacterized protein LOC114257583 [Camellia sinensis]